MDFANRFKTLRKEKGYTQQQIADLCFLDKSTVCRWEKGDNYPNQQTQSKLADLLGVSIDYLMGRTDMRMISFPFEAVIDMPIIGSVRGGMDGNVVQEETGETRAIAASAPSRAFAVPASASASGTPSASLAHSRGQNFANS